MLGDIQLFKDSSGTWDPAAWQDWLIALEEKESVTSLDDFKSIYRFLNAYYIRTSCSSSDIKALMDSMKFAEQKDSELSTLWHTWQECVEKNTRINP